MACQSFSRESKLVEASQFKRVFDENERRASCQFALILSLPNGQTRSRLGLVVAKKHVKQANQRNRIKRLVREHFRQHPLNQERDLVFLARTGIANLDNEQIRGYLSDLWRKLNR